MSKKNTVRETSHEESICDKVGEIAVQYGFTVVKPPHITNDDISKSKQFKEFDYYGDTEEKIALTRWYTEKNLQMESQPVMIHYRKPLSGGNLRKKPSEEMYGFEIMGSNRTTSEALLVKVALAVLCDLGYNDVYIDINSIGDKESISRFERELSGHFRKNAHSLPAKIRQEFKKNHYSILKNTEGTEEFKKEMPQVIGSLSDIARLHFKEVLEYLEAFEIMYKIKGDVLSNKLHATHTVFEIRDVTSASSADSPKRREETDGTLLAYGYRYNYLAKKLGQKRDIPSIGLTIIVKKVPELSKKIPIKNIKRPHFYLVQLGPSAKLKALNVVEHLRKHKIPVYHSLTKDKITGQLTGAEYMHASHVLIIGQKEALENTVVVRDVVTRVQETVSQADLPEFLKKIGKGK